VTLATTAIEKLRAVKAEWEGVFRENRPVHLADLCGREPSTIGRRFEKDDRLNAFPADDFLLIVHGLRREQPGLRLAVIDAISDPNATTKTLDLGTRINSAMSSYAAEIDAAASLLQHAPISADAIRRLRRQQALAIHATNKLIAAAEAKLEAQTRGRPF
jgi:hypothetical protein